MNGCFINALNDAESLVEPALINLKQTRIDYVLTKLLTYNYKVK